MKNCLLQSSCRFTQQRFLQCNAEKPEADVNSSTGDNLSAAAPSSAQPICFAEELSKSAPAEPVLPARVLGQSHRGALRVLLSSLMDSQGSGDACTQITALLFQWLAPVVGVFHLKISCISCSDIIVIIFVLSSFWPLFLKKHNQSIFSWFYLYLLSTFPHGVTRVRSMLSPSICITLLSISAPCECLPSKINTGMVSHSLLGELLHIKPSCACAQECAQRAPCCSVPWRIYVPHMCQSYGVTVLQAMQGKN